MKRNLILLAVVAAIAIPVGASFRAAPEPVRSKSRPKRATPPQAAGNLDTPGVTRSWLQSVNRYIDQKQRQIQQDRIERETFHAASRSCIVSVRAEGMKVKSSHHEDTWRLAWSWCTVAGLSPAPAKVWSPTEHDLRIDRGCVQEYIENRVGGLEHVIEVLERPPTSGPLRVEIDVASGLAISTPDPSDRLVFSDSSGSPVLQYRGLTVWDADRVELAATFEVTPKGFAILVRDESARYPVTIDPIFDDDPAEWEGVGGAAGDLFGWSVASAGDVGGDTANDLIVGAPGFDDGTEADAGAVYVFFGSTGPFNPDAVADITLDNGFLGGDQHGWAVAGGGDLDGQNGNDFLVGCPGFDQGTAVDAGAAIAYCNNGSGGWTMTFLGVATTQGGAQHGYSVASLGDLNDDGFPDCVVGAPFHDAPAVAPANPAGPFAPFVDAGQITLYVDVPQSSTFAAATATYWGAIPGFPFVVQPEPGAQFGWSVAAAGQVNPGVGGDDDADALIGAPGANGGDGRVFMYFANDTTDTLMPFAGWVEDGPADSSFGTSVAGAVDVNDDGYPDALIGAPLANDGTADTGAAYVYLGIGANGYEATEESSLWVEAGGDLFGTSVAWGALAVDEGYIIIGSPGADTGAGRAYSFIWTADNDEVTIDPDDPAYASGAAAGDNFGWSVALVPGFDDDSIYEAAVGAPLGGAGGEGLADVFFEE